MKKILIVEDDECNIFLLKELLYKNNTLIFAETGLEFYDIINNIKDIDIIIMDYRLPDTDGIELCKYMVNNNINIPIIFSSAYNNNYLETKDLNIKYFLQKPISKELLEIYINK